MPDAEFQEYISGRKLIGDDFDATAIARWYADEAEGYAGLKGERGEYEYEYHALNRRHGFSQLPPKCFASALGLGAAYGEEFRPLAGRIEAITILDPSDKFVVSEVSGVPVSYRKPDVSGSIPLAGGSFDLVTSLGTLHHIPNVSHVVGELARVTKSGGYVLVREPVVNMGDWRKPRHGLTKRERGIPRAYMRRMFREAGLKVISERACMFPGTGRLARLAGIAHPFNSDAMVLADWFMSACLAWNTHYDRRGLKRKIAPSSVYWACLKQDA